MKKRVLLLAVAVTLLLGGIAYASIPGPDGTIHGCYKTSNPGQGALLAIDSAATCPSGFTALNWNQTGPQGPAGPSGLAGLHTVSQRFSIPGNASFEQRWVECPTGETELGGGWGFSPNGKVFRSKPSEETSFGLGPGWFVAVVNPDPTAADLDIYVRCAPMS